MSADATADAPYWKGLADGVLMLPKCPGCGAWRWPAGRRCGACGTVGLLWVEQPMRGSLFSWTRTWHRFALTESLDLPFTSAVVELAPSGIRLMGRLTDPDQIDPAIGAPVTGVPSSTLVGERHIPTILWSRT